jgi:MerR family copper efflux transcriptional regulator
MVIGEAAAASGVNAKMIRYYESIGLLPAATRTQAGYRTYGDGEVETLRFVRRARDLGLSIPRIKLLVGLWRNGGRASREVKRIALDHIGELQARIVEMEAMRSTLQALADQCRGDDGADCPILGELDAGARVAAGHPRAPARRGHIRP